jgi:hypothetical protein
MESVFILDQPEEQFCVWKGVLVSFDVSLFTNVPVDEALEIHLEFTPER